MTKTKRFIKENHLWMWLFFSIFILFANSKNSFFFHTNDWVDANAFFTVGKGMMHHLVPYKDLFEQKGPFLYFIYGLSSLISPQKFTGVWLFEVAALTVDLVCAWKIFRLYFTKHLSLGLTAFFPLLLMDNYYFRQGGSAEEFCIPFLMIFFYQLLANFKAERGFLFSKWIYLWQGFSVAYIFLTKFTLLGPWIAFYLFTFGYHLWRKNVKELGKLFLFSLIGFLAGTIPWLIYFLVHHALNDFFEAYIFINTKVYNDGSFSILKRLFFIIQIVGQNFKENYTNFFLLLPGIIVLPLLKKISPRLMERMFLLLTALSCLFFIYVGLRGYKYYFLFFMPFGIFGYIFLGDVFDALIQKESKILDLRWNLLLPLIFCVAYFAALTANTNINESDFFPTNSTVESKVSTTKAPKSAQQKFAAYMLGKKKQPTLLNYNSLDAGFYLAADVLPVNKDFQLLNIDPKAFPDNFEGQKKMVADGKVDFVVVEKKQPLTEEKIAELGLNKHYQLVKKHQQYRDNKKRYYYLFEKV